MADEHHAPNAPRDAKSPPDWLRSPVAGLLAAGLAAFAVHAADGTLHGAIIAGAAVFAGMAVWRGTSPASARFKGEAAPGRDRAGTPFPAPLLPQMTQNLLEGLPDPALILDGEATVLAANASAHSLLTVARGRHISQTSRSPELLSMIDAVLARKGQQRGETKIRAAIEHHLSILVTPLAAEPGRDAASLIVVLRDLSEQEQLTRMRADFVANASHELRTPLASLKGFLETLRGPAKDDAQARDMFLAIMQEQADRMSRLIDDLLSLNRIEMREHVRPIDRVDLSEIANHVARTVEPLAAKAGISVEGPVAGEPVIVRGDRDELIQLAQNLAQNAIKYGRSGGHVKLAAKRIGVRAELSVADDGIGIAPEHVPRLTERFYRVSAKDSRERGGTGLGLAIVKHIVNRHQGELKVESRLGHGSTFTVRMPVAEAAPRAIAVLN